MTPLFITFEGLDGSGKSTHLRRAAAWMEARGLEVVVTQEPGGTELGEAIRALFLDVRDPPVDGPEEALLVFASRRRHLRERIEPALAAGRHVLCDRFTDSTHAYQGAGRGLDRTFIERLDELATDRRSPEVTLLFDLPAEDARRRSAAVREGVAADRLDAESLAFYERVRTRYLELARDEPERIRVVDSAGDREATWSQVEAVLGGALERVEGAKP